MPLAARSSWAVCIAVIRVPGCGEAITATVGACTAAVPRPQRPRVGSGRRRSSVPH